MVEYFCLPTSKNIYFQKIIYIKNIYKKILHNAVQFTVTGKFVER